MPFIKSLLWGAVLFTSVLTAVSGHSNVPVFDIPDEGLGPNIPFDDVLGGIPNFVFPSVEASVTKIRRPTSIDRQALATDPSSTISKVDPTSVPGRSNITVDDILGEIPSSILKDVEEFVTKISTLPSAERQAIAINIVSTIMDVNNIPDFGNSDIPFDNVLGEIPSSILKDVEEFVTKISTLPSAERQALAINILSTIIDVNNIPDFGNSDIPFDNVLGEIPDFVPPTPTTKVDTMVTESPSALHHSHFLGFVTTFTKAISSDAKVIPSKLPTLSGASFAPTEAIPSSLITASPILAGSTTFRKVRSVTSSRSSEQVM
jgi:hypothetical protein